MDLVSEESVDVLQVGLCCHRSIIPPLQNRYLAVILAYELPNVLDFVLQEVEVYIVLLLVIELVAVFVVHVGFFIQLSGSIKSSVVACS